MESAFGNKNLLREMFGTPYQLVPWMSAAATRRKDPAFDGRDFMVLTFVLGIVPNLINS